MIVYWALLVIPITAFLMPVKLDKHLSNLQWIFYGVILTLIIGLRHEVGGDWVHYINDNDLYLSLKEISFFEIFTFNNLPHDIGFLVTHWFSQNFFNGIYTTNLICAAIFVSGLLRLCRNLPVPWMALVIAMPYLVIVVAMGYTRQSAALGFIMWGLVDLMYGNKGKFYRSIFLAILFHKTALIMLIIGFFYKNHFYKRRGIKDYSIFALVLVFVAVIYNFLWTSLSYYIEHPGYQSSGAIIRISMSVAAALVFLRFWKPWNNVYDDGRIWLLFSVVIFTMLPLAFVFSTVADRLALYFLPMQIVIFSRVIVLIVDKNTKYLFIVSILTAYSGVLYVWLNHSIHSVLWLPYSNILFY